MNVPLVANSGDLPDDTECDGISFEFSRTTNDPDDEDDREGWLVLEIEGDTTKLVVRMNSVVLHNGDRSP